MEGLWPCIAGFWEGSPNHQALEIPWFLGYQIEQCLFCSRGIETQSLGLKDAGQIHLPTADSQKREWTSEFFGGHGWLVTSWLVGGFIYFLMFTPLPGEMIQFD